MDYTVDTIWRAGELAMFFWPRQLDHPICLISFTVQEDLTDAVVLCIIVDNVCEHPIYQIPRHMADARTLGKVL
jgi:hypothetical protein